MKDTTPMDELNDTPPLCYWGFSPSKGFPAWFPDTERLMISAARLWNEGRDAFSVCTVPPVKDWFLDSGAFTAVNAWGMYPWTAEQYLDLIWKLRPAYVATMDYPCEDDAPGRMIHTEPQRVWATIQEAKWLLNQDLPDETTVVPVIQGYSLEQYLWGIFMMWQEKVLTDYMAVGSMSRRVNVERMARLMTHINNRVQQARPGAKLHWFGLKLNALADARCYPLIHSLDTSAWSMNAESMYPKGDCRERLFAYRDKLYQIKAQMVTDRSCHNPHADTNERRPELIPLVAKLGSGIPKAIKARLDEKDETLAEIEMLQALGITHAVPHWRDKKYLYLIHPQVGGERKREYIGCDPVKCAEAFGRVERGKQYVKLRRRVDELDRQLHNATRELLAVYAALDAKPPSGEGR